MALHPEILDVDHIDSIEPVLAVMATFTDRGRGWINIRPRIAADAAPSNRSSLTQFFRRNSPEVALGTWMAPATNPDGALQNVGVQHALGTRLAPVLDAWELSLAPGWRRLQDSPRRGLLVAIPADEGHDTVLRWLLELTLVATSRETSGSWQVSIYEGRGS